MVITTNALEAGVCILFFFFYGIVSVSKSEKISVKTGMTKLYDSLMKQRTYCATIDNYKKKKKANSVDLFIFTYLVIESEISSDSEYCQSNLAYNDSWFTDALDSIYRKVRCSWQ